MLKRWTDLSDVEKKLFIKQANVYAAYLAYTDSEIGRVIAEVERLARSFSLDGREARDTWMRDVQFRREYAALYAELETVRLMISPIP
jgi:hypothetical protein